MTAAEILAREHREALSRMDAAQMRAVRRLVKALQDPDRGVAEALDHQITTEAGLAHPPAGLTLPEWMLG